MLRFWPLDRSQAEKQCQVTVWGKSLPFTWGSAVWWMDTCELHYIDSAKSAQVMKAHGSFVRMAFLAFEILRIILFI